MVEMERGFLKLWYGGAAVKSLACSQLVPGLFSSLHWCVRVSLGQIVHILVLCLAPRNLWPHEE